MSIANSPSRNARKLNPSTTNQKSRPFKSLLAANDMRNSATTAPNLPVRKKGCQRQVSWGAGDRHKRLGSLCLRRCMARDHYRSGAVRAGGLARLFDGSLRAEPGKDPKWPLLGWSFRFLSFGSLALSKCQTWSCYEGTDLVLLLSCEAELRHMKDKSLGFQDLLSSQRAPLECISPPLSARNSLLQSCEMQGSSCIIPTVQVAHGLEAEGLTAAGCHGSRRAYESKGLTPLELIPLLLSLM